MYFSCRLRSFRAVYNRPGTNLLRSRCQKTDISEQVITCPYERVKTAFLNAEVGKKRLFVVVGKLRLNLCAYADKLRAFAFGKVGQLFVCFAVFKVAADHILAYVCDVNNGLHGKKFNVFYFFLFLACERDCTGGNSVFETFLYAHKNIQLVFERFITLHCFFRAQDALFKHFKVGEDKLKVYRFNVAERVDLAVNVNNV